MIEVLSIAIVSALAIGSPGVPRSPSAPAEATEARPLSVSLTRARLEAAAEELAGEPQTPEASQALVAALDELADRSPTAELEARTRYDLGLARLGVGDPLGAAESFRDADWLSFDSGLRSEARFNLGHALVHAANAQDQSRGDPVESLLGQAGALREAAAAFRSVLDVDPRHADAARNCEIVRRMIRETEQQAEQMQEMLDQLSEQANELSQLAEEQQEASDQSAQADQSQQEQLQSQQQSLSDRTDQAQQAMNQTSEQMGDQGAENLSEANQQLDRARAAQQEAEEALERGDLQDASEAQQEAAEALEAAGEAVEQAGEQEAEGEQEGQTGQDEHQTDTGAEEAPPQEEGDAGTELAHRLLERERREREDRELRRSRLGRPIEVERDW